MMKFNYYYFWFFFFFFFSLLFFFCGIYMLYFDYSLICEWSLISLHSLSLIYVIYLDWISLSFMSVVMLISSMVIIYSKNYMGELNYSSIRFLLLVVMFVFSMMLMILSPNLISILVGWDGLGLVSYCLVIYYSSSKSYLAGMITCLTNRLGDIGLLISISWVFCYGSWSFMFYLDFFNSYIFYLLIISSFTKSAQIPFSCWLPSAMAAPTPVSSLVHSSTLVTAGVYLMIRFSLPLNMNKDLFLFISLLTTLMASFCASFEFDLKKVIALSTLSQLGLMMMSLFMDLLSLSYFHLLSHAMFKSLLFLCSGLMIYYMEDNQDIRMMGSISYMIPYVSCCFNISNMALFGMPFMSGFYSKDLILEVSVFHSMSIYMFMMFYLSLGLTAFYSIRLFYYSVLKNFFYSSCLLGLYEDLNAMKMSISVLSFFSVVYGSMYMWMTNLDLTFVTMSLDLKLLSLLMVFMGLFLGYESNFMTYMFYMNFYLFNGSMWFLMGYSWYLYSSFYKFSGHVLKFSFWGEFYGAFGLSMYMLKISNYFQFYSLNSLKIFFMVFLFWILFLI
nr:NADH dehydrogenase subunit 5 [Acostemma sp.]